MDMLKINQGVLGLLSLSRYQKQFPLGTTTTTMSVPRGERQIASVAMFQFPLFGCYLSITGSVLEKNIVKIVVGDLAT